MFQQFQTKFRYITGSVETQYLAAPHVYYSYPLVHDRSVVVSLRLLPKIIYSFQQYRSEFSCHCITQWAEKELHMMEHFFSDLVHYTDKTQEQGAPTNSL